MKCTLISREALLDEFDRLLEAERGSEENKQLLYGAIDAVERQQTMFPETECAPVSFWQKCHDQNQDTTWWECHACRTLGSPRWKRCPMCEAVMRASFDSDGD